MASTDNSLTPSQVTPAASLRGHSDFMKLWTAQAVSTFGSKITREALPYVAVLTLAATPFQLGLLGAASAAPVLAISLFAGVWVDRLRRRPILIAADLGRALLVGSVPVAVLFGKLTIVQLYVVAALAGVLTVFSDVADRSYLPVLVGRSQIAEGNRKLATTGSLAEVGGPALSGLLVQALTAPVAVALDALSFLWSALWLSLIRTREPAPPPVEHRVSALADIKAGFGVVLSHPLLRPLALSAAVVNFFGGSYGALYIIFAVRELGIAPGVLGLLIAVGGVGSLVGAVGLRWIGRRLGLGRSITYGGILSTAIMLLFVGAPGHSLLTVLLVFLTQGICDFAAEVQLVNAISLRQSLLPPSMLGRANASMNFLGGLGLISMLLSGVAAEIIGIRATLLIATLGMIAGSVWLLFTPVAALVDIPTVEAEA